MAQLYFLSIVANIIAGLILSSDYLGRKMAFLNRVKMLNQNKNLKISLGLVGVVIGVLKLIVKSPGETVPVAGDLLPALYGIGLGLMLLGETFGRGVKENGNATQQKDSGIFAFRTPVGIIGVIVSLVHFVMPGVMIL